MKKLFSMLLCGAMLIGFSACEQNNDVNNGEVNSGDANIHEYVDLGLPSGTLWATCNVGATSPEEVGSYFAWGETRPKEIYSWDTYKYGTYNEEEYYYGYEYDFSTLTKYTLIDGKTILESSDDAATANWGGDWRMPTLIEQEELFSKCTWIWDSTKKGYTVTGLNGNSIFLPSGGGYLDGTKQKSHNVHVAIYWSSLLVEGYPAGAFYLALSFDDGEGTYLYDWNDGYRCWGIPVRPVCSSR